MDMKNTLKKIFYGGLVILSFLAVKISTEYILGL